MGSFLAQAETHREHRLARSVCWQGFQRAGGAQGRFIKDGVTTALLNTGSNDVSVFVDDQEDQYLPFLAACNGFGRIELAGGIQLFQLFANRLCPGFRGFNLGWSGRRLTWPGYPGGGLWQRQGRRRGGLGQRRRS